jgi:hypothetical protein
MEANVLLPVQDTIDRTTLAAIRTAQMELSLHGASPGLNAFLRQTGGSIVGIRLILSR